MVDTFDIPEHMHRSGGFGGRANVGERWFKLVTEDAALPPDGAVLDIGCGLGRIAQPLMRYVKGRYEGFDIDPPAIEWCKANLEPRAPNFKFTLIDASSKRYNAAGVLEPSSVKFPYEDNAFDVVFLASVFTHLLPATVAHYLREIARVLVPGGRTVISYFLLNPAWERALAEGRLKPRYKFPHELEGCRIRNPNIPEAAVAHHEDKIRALYAECGLTITWVRYGRWSGNRKGKSGQDLILAKKG